MLGYVTSWQRNNCGSGSIAVGPPNIVVYLYHSTMVDEKEESAPLSLLGHHLTTTRKKKKKKKEKTNKKEKTSKLETWIMCTKAHELTKELVQTFFFPFHLKYQ